MNPKKRQPKIAGYYWYKAPDDPDWQIVKVVVKYGDPYVLFFSGYRLSLRQAKGEWLDERIQKPEGEGE